MILQTQLEFRCQAPAARLERSWAAFPDFQAGSDFIRREARLDGGVMSGAVFDPIEAYRYLLWRCFDPARPPLVACMLNPSKATELDSDPTVDKIGRWARAWGYGGLVVVNAFAFRSTDPAELYRQVSPVRPDNDRAIRAAARVAGMVLCGWGTHAAHPQFQGRADAVARLLLNVVEVIYCTRLNQGGTPKHPLYERNDSSPMVWMRNTW